MSLGLGIFLSTAMLSLLLLYRFTQDRWNWKKIVHRVGYVLGGGVILGVTIFAAVYLNQKVQSIPTKQTSYLSLSLGMSMPEVEYTKGVPDNVLTEVDTPPKPPDGSLLNLPTKELKDDQPIENYFYWSYDLDKEGTRLDIEFNKKAKTVTSIRCYSRDQISCPPLLNIQDGSSESEIKKTLREPSAQKIEGVTKRLIYDKLGTVFFLEKAHVYMIEIRLSN